MRTTRLRRLALPVSLAMAAGLLAGCGGGGDEASPSPTKTAKSEATGDSSSSASAEESESAEPAAAGGGDDCLTGTWDTDVDGMLKQMEVLMGDAIGDTDITATGGVTTTFKDGTLAASYDAFTLTFVMTAEGMDMTMTMGFDGDATATYSAADGQLTIGSMDMSTVDITYTAKVGDQTMDMSDQVGDSMSGVGASSGTSAYVCDGSTLTTTASAGGTEVTQVYHRK